MKKKSWFLLGIVGFLLMVAFVYRKSFSFHILSLPEIIHWVEEARSHGELTAVFYVFFVFGVMCLPITIFPVVGGVLLDFSWALPLNLMAATTGAVFSFLLTRVLGRARIQKLFKGRWKLIDHLTAQEGLKSVLFLRLLGVPPFIVTNYMLGLSAVRLRDFFLGTLVGVLPWMAVITYAARSLWEAAVVGGEKGFRAAIMELVAPFTLVSIVILATTLFGYFRKQKKKAHSNL